MARLDLNDFKANAKRAITDRPKVGGIFSEPNQRTFSLPLDALFYRVKIRLGNPCIESLTASLDRFGQIEPIIVHKIDEGYEIINGHQRVLALSILGKDDVVATLHDADDTQALFLPYILNPAESLSAIEIANYLRTLTVDYGVLPQQIKEQTGLDINTYERLQVDQDLLSVFDEQPTYEESMQRLNELYDATLGKKYHIKTKGFKLDKSGQKFRIDADERHLSFEDITAVHRLIDYIRTQEG